MRNLLLLFIILLPVTRANACEVTKLEALNFSLSTEENAVVAYQEDRPLHESPVFRVSNCAGPAVGGQFLMVALGPEVVEFEDRIRGLNFTGNYGAKKCQLEGTPFDDVSDYERRHSRFKADWEFLRSCVDVIVQDEGPQKLGLPEAQPGCQLSKISDHSASFNGGYCFFKPGFASSYLIKLNVKPECASLSALKERNILSSDIAAGLNFYVAGDASGSSGNLTALSNTALRFAYNPVKQILPASDDYGLTYPTWPEEWASPDIHFSEMRLKNPTGTIVKVELPFIVNNNCKRSCVDGVCQSPCDYAQPIVAEYLLYELGAGKPELITTWYDGGIAPPGFVGEVMGVNFEAPASYFEEGKEYKIEAIFTDPRYDFDRFKRRIKNRINTINQQIGGITNSGIPGITEIPTINTTTTLPGLGTIPDVVFNYDLDDIEQAVEQLRSFLSFRLWPPYYTKACGQNECVSLDRSFLTLGVRFKIEGAETDSEDGPDAAELTYSVKEVYRRSSLVPSYSKNAFFKPSVTCDSE